MEEENIFLCYFKMTTDYQKYREYYKSYYQQYYQNNSSLYIAKNLAFYYNNLDKCREYRRNYYYLNKSKINEYRQKNRESIKQYQHNYNLLKKYQKKHQQSDSFIDDGEINFILEIV